MARQLPQARRRGFRDLRGDPQLRPLVLPNVRPTGRRIGGGAYGTVEELDVDGLLCAGKKLHDILLEDDNPHTQNIVDKFVEECSLLAGVHHPHVVQFLGICFLDTSDVPVLVMEYLPYCLDILLEGARRVDMPLSMKLSILRDVAQGLAHLHARAPPVIHRDLTAKNILLTMAMMGKIADLGVARILNLQPGRLAVTMTQTPGTLAYMPPEALARNPQYNAAIDMFSFGHLTLFTIVQAFPYPTEPTLPDPNNPGMVIGLTEVQRRSEQMEQLTRQLGGGRHPLVQLVTQCLHNDPRQRPSARQVLSQLERMRAQIQDPHEGMSKLELIQALRRREGGGGEGGLQAQVTQLQGDLQARGVELEASQAETQQVQRQLQASQAESQQYQGDLQARGVELEASRAETQQVQRQLQAESQQYQSRLEQVQGDLQARGVQLEASRAQLQAEAQRTRSRIQHMEAQWRADVQQYQSRVQQAEGELRSRPQEIEELRAQLRRREAEVTELTRTAQQPQAHQPPRAFTWRRGRDGLFGTHKACAVVLNGEVYVGGGWAARDEDRYIIQVYSPESDGWRRLPQCPVRRFAMAAVNQQLVLVGGCSRNHQAHSTVLVWNSTSQGWNTPYPNMPTARASAAAVSYQQFLVVAGGYDQSNRDLNTVNILNSSTKQWVTAAPLPTACYQLSPALVGDTLYLLGGYADGTPSKQMFSTSISALISHATSTSRAPPPNWDVTDTKLARSAAVSLNNSLLAVGGEDDIGKDSSAIYHYHPQSKRWTKVGDVRSALSRCACTALPSGELMVLEGYAGSSYVDGVHIAKVD